MQNLLGGDEAMARARMPDIVADAAYEILSRDPRECTGNVFIDDEVLAEAGVTDLDRYSGKPGADLALDIFIDGLVRRHADPRATSTAPVTESRTRRSRESLNASIARSSSHA